MLNIYYTLYVKYVKYTCNKVFEQESNQTFLKDR